MMVSANASKRGFLLGTSFSHLSLANITNPHEGRSCGADERAPKETGKDVYAQKGVAAVEKCVFRRLDFN